MRKRLCAVLATALMLAGCSGAGDTATTVDLRPPSGSPSSPASDRPPDLDPAKVVIGAELYASLCASCHGADLGGDPNWRVMNEDGSFPPPPQDSSGHTWHHGDDLLVEIILEGSGFRQSRMSAFGDRLREDEVLAILEFFKSNWGTQERKVQWEVTLRERAQS